MCIRDRLGDVQDLSGFLDLLVDLVLGSMTQLQSEGHVLVNGHVAVSYTHLDVYKRQSASCLPVP